MRIELYDLTAWCLFATFK